MHTKILYAIILITQIVFAQNQTPIVENVTFMQRKDGTFKVDIYYDVNDPDGNTMTISMKVSADNGSTWNFSSNNITGDVGSGITSGTGKHIVWDFGTEHPQTFGDQFRIKILADDNAGGTLPGMIFVQGGTFQMGSNAGDSDEQPIHSVTVNSFYISKYEITHKEYIEFLNAYGVSSNGSYGGIQYIDMYSSSCAVGHNGNSFYFKGSSSASTENTPVIEVTWYGAKAYCEWAGGRLPTEAEWEFAARGGTQSNGYSYSGSNTIGDVAWYWTNSGLKSHEVGTKQPNELGIYDMSGNVWEWCSDWYAYDYYSSSPANNPQGPSSGSNRVLRGGSWRLNASSCRVAYRLNIAPGTSNSLIGFRLAKGQ